MAKHGCGGRIRSSHINHHISFSQPARGQIFPSWPSIYPVTLQDHTFRLQVLRRLPNHVRNWRVVRLRCFTSRRRSLCKPRVDTKYAYQSQICLLVLWEETELAYRIRGRFDRVYSTVLCATVRLVLVRSLESSSFCKSASQSVTVVDECNTVRHSTHSSASSNDPTIGQTDGDSGWLIDRPKVARGYAFDTWISIISIESQVFSPRPQGPVPSPC